MNTESSTAVPAALYKDGIARFLTYCIGVSLEQAKLFRNAYQHGLSESSEALERAVGTPYTMSIRLIEEHNLMNALHLFSRFSEAVPVPHAPQVVVLGDDFKAPYSEAFLEWLRWAKPSVVRMQKQRVQVVDLPTEEYYLGTCSVFSTDDIENSDAVSSELDYCTLVYLNYRRYVNVDDSAMIACSAEEQVELMLLLSQSMGLSDSSAFPVNAVLDNTFHQTVKDHNCVGHFPGCRWA